MSVLQAKAKHFAKDLEIGGIITANCFDLSPEFHTLNDCHENWELVYIDSGSVIYHLENNDLKLTQGQVIFHRPGEIHSGSCDGHQSATIFTLTFDCTSPQIEFFDKNKVVKVQGEAAHLLKKIIKECSSTYRMSIIPLSVKPDAPFGGEQIILNYLEAFLLLLMRNEEGEGSFNASKSQESGSNLLTESICEYLKEHIYDKVTLDLLSEHFHFGKVYLCHTFKKKVGCSIINYFTDLKITEAKRLLRESELTVLEISDKLGFESPSYFSRCFKNRVGHSPQSFRKMLINDSMLKKRK